MNRGGRHIDPTVAATDPLIEYVDGVADDQKVVGYIITNPVGGTWQLNIAAASDVEAGGESYMAETTSQSPVDTTLSASAELVGVGSTIDLYLTVTDNDVPVTGATVTAEATDRFGAGTLLTCLDGGVPPDLTANDGVYSCSYGPLTTSGNHSVAFQVSGTDLGMVGFERAQFSELSVNSDSAVLAGTFSETVTDSDSNTLFETLAIDVDLTVTEAGTYTLSGSLKDTASSLIDSKVVSSVVLPAGPATIRLGFEGFLIRENGVPGSYTLTDVSLNRSDEDRALCDFGTDLYTTSTYNATDFEIRDPDSDDIASDLDNCPNIPNPLQEDGDTDTIGDACDNCSNVSNATQSDADLDTFGDACDLCSSIQDAFQSDTDGDTLGNNCDPDADNDGVANAQDCSPLNGVVWSPALEVTDLQIASDAVTISWAPQTAADGSAVTYDVVKGDLLVLHAAGGNFSDAVCFADHQASSTATDAFAPPVGGGYYYLVRSRTTCGADSYGSGTGGPRTVPACP